ncbi:MAG: DUF6600 domain-containing protein [Steroidobacteraceae bacterium]
MREFLVKSAGAIRVAALVALSLMLGVALADEADPPGRVARLSYVQGSVSLEPAGAQNWIAAEVNRPLTTSDRLWSDAPGSRAELDIGGAVIRLGSSTGFSLLNLDDNTAQMQVTAGTVIVHVRELLDNQTYEIDTPNLALVLDQPGQYRVDVNTAGDTTVVTVSEGQAEAAGGGQTIPVTNQQMVTFMGTDQLSATATTLGAPDGLDDWSFERDREFDQSASRQYVADDVAGTGDLDDNGQWENTPDYGYVWIPTAVAVGWAPYSVGHWAWIVPWGWTWVDAAAWGFAPFHYGRWARWRDSWCWVPGPRQVRPVYAPAMVAWVGGGAGVGWFPLGPREVYVPGYRVSDRYARTINITNTTVTDYTNITNVYRNRSRNMRYANSGIPGAVTSVPQSVFTAAQPVNAHRVHLPASQIAHISATAAPPAIAPVRQSVLGGAGGYGHRPPQALLNRAVMARTAPPAAPGVRVRLVAPTQAHRGPGFNRPGPSVQQSRPSMQQPPSMPQRPATQQRPGSAAPPASVGGDARSLAERERALEQSSLPPPRAPRDDRSPTRPSSSPAPDRPAPGRTFRDDRPPAAYPSERVEQARPPLYSRPPLASHPVEQHRAAPEPAPAPPRAARFTAPPPPPAPAPRPPPAPARVTPPPQQHAPAAGHTEERSAPRAPAHIDPHGS